MTRAVSKARSAAVLEEQASRVALEAYLLRQRGKSWWQIAEALGLSETGARNAVEQATTRAVELVSEQTKRSLLVLETDRLDALMDAHWEAATQPHVKVDKDGNPNLEPPDVRAAEMVLKVIAARTKLLGLEAADTAATSTVVISGHSEEYVKALQLIAGGGEAS